MKLITSNKELRHEFHALMEKYDQWEWLVAWASDVDLLRKFQDQILSGKKTIRFVVGLRFYQTDPRFIERFLNDKRVRYIEQQTGTFHPKMYLFSDKYDSNWAMLVGSGNFTAAAFSKNQEASILITNEDEGDDVIFQNARSFTAEMWKKARVFDKASLESYEENCKKYKINHEETLLNLPLPSLEKPAFSIEEMTWEEYVRKIKEEESQEKIRNRMDVIKTVKELFERGEPFCEFSYEERKYVAGFGQGSGHFGSMRGAGDFMHRISENDLHISEALDAIPLQGDVTQQNYEHFVKLFNEAFRTSARQNQKVGATRLLAMKRPDVFVCLNEENKGLRTAFGLPSSKSVKLEEYWEKVVERIRNSGWWKNPDPKNDEEIIICNARAAFLDSLYCTRH